MEIDGRLIGGETAYCIAEIGHNHGGDIERCKEMILAAKKCGVDAVKLQKRDSQSLFTKELYGRTMRGQDAYGKTFGEHWEALELSFEQYKELKEYAGRVGLTFFATAFDFVSVDFLEKLGVPCYKIASGDLLNTPLQKYIAGTGKPVILSTGGGSYEDVSRAYETVMRINKNLVLMQCTISYPCEPQDIHLSVIGEYKKRYPDIVIGFSDHFIGKMFGPPAYVLGARVFEKHFTLNKHWKGTNHWFSLEQEDMAKYVRDIHNVVLAMNSEKNVLECEIEPLYERGKKLIAARKVKAGEVLTEADIRIVSPNDGLSPYEIDNFIGKKLKQDLEEESNLTWEAVG